MKAPIKTDFVLHAMVWVMVALLSSWVTVYFCDSESKDSTKENQCPQPTIVIIKETIHVEK